MSSVEHGLEHGGGHGVEIEPGAHAHPGPRVYVIIGVILAVITGLELWVYNEEVLRRFLAPILLALSACKFAIVVGYYMHLRFDNRLFTAIFGFGLLVAGSVIT